MQSISKKAYGKINLTLNIVGKSDGYHMLDTICCTVNKYDKITVKKRKDNVIIVNLLGPYGNESFVQSELNAYKAAVKFQEKYDTCGVSIDIIRNIPNGSGMGGSSADIAGVLNAMSELFEIKESQKEIADSIGSDAGYLLGGGFARLTGRGEIVTPIPTDWRLYFVIIYGKKGVITKDCFELYDKRTVVSGENRNDEVERFCMLKSLQDIKGKENNDLYEVSAEINPEIRENLAALKELSPDFASMTGSGSSVYAIYDTYEMASWALSKLRPKYGYNVDLVTNYNPLYATPIEKIRNVFQGK